MTNKSWSQAKAAGDKHYFTGKPCLRGHISLRQTSGMACMECKREQQAERMKDPEKRAKHVASVVACTKRKRATSDDFRTKDNAYRKEWMRDKMKDPAYAEKARAVARASAAARRAKNPTKNRFKAASYKAVRVNRAPPWLTKEHRSEMRAFYAIRDWLNATMFGAKYEVDHIVPLRGRTVSGLHVPWNLQVLRAKENARKGNTHEATT